MSTALVAYGTKHGATREIAEAIADELRRAGHDPDCMEAEAAKGVDDYDAVIVGRASESRASSPVPAGTPVTPTPQLAALPLVTGSGEPDTASTAWRPTPSPASTTTTPPSWAAPST